MNEDRIKDAIVIPASEAEYSRGVGVDLENRLEVTRVNADGMIVSLAPGGFVTFRMPEEVNGRYDVSVRVSATLAQTSSQPFLFSVNGEMPWAAPVDCRPWAGSPAHIDERIPGMDAALASACTEEEIADNFPLHAGDVLQIRTGFGANAAELAGEAFPGIAALVLLPHEPRVRTGTDPLSGKKILWLGSSVTYGAQSAGHYSMVEAMRERHPGLLCEKYAVCGTTLANTSADSYPARLRQIPAWKCPDLVVVQLSTNDAVQGKVLGRISAGTEPDETTIAGAIEAIILDIRERFHCPVVFYTGTWFDCELYREMTELLADIQKKWGIGIIDLFHDAEMCRVIGTPQYERYMHDPIHPFRAGYTEWWTPVIDLYLARFLQDGTQTMEPRKE